MRATYPPHPCPLCVCRNAASVPSNAGTRGSSALDPFHPLRFHPSRSRLEVSSSLIIKSHPIPCHPMYMPTYIHIYSTHVCKPHLHRPKRHAPAPSLARSSALRPYVHLVPILRMSESRWAALEMQDGWALACGSRLGESARAKLRGCFRYVDYLAVCISILGDVGVWVSLLGCFPWGSGGVKDSFPVLGVSHVVCTCMLSPGLFFSACVGTVCTLLYVYACTHGDFLDISSTYICVLVRYPPF